MYELLITIWLFKLLNLIRFVVIKSSVIHSTLCRIKKEVEFIQTMVPRGIV